MAAKAFDISASLSTNTANNSAAGPATSGGVSVGDVNFGGGGSGLFFKAPTRGTDWRPVVALGLVAAGVIWYLKRKG